MIQMKMFLLNVPFQTTEFLKILYQLMNYLEKTLRILETSVLVNNNNLCGKLVWLLESPIAFDERIKVTSVPILFLILAY